MAVSMERSSWSVPFFSLSISPDNTLVITASSRAGCDRFREGTNFDIQANNRFRGHFRAGYSARYVPLSAFLALSQNVVDNYFAQAGRDMLSHKKGWVESFQKALWQLEHTITAGSPYVSPTQEAFFNRCAECLARGEMPYPAKECGLSSEDQKAMHTHFAGSIQARQEFAEALQTRIRELTRAERSEGQPEPTVVSWEQTEDTKKDFNDPFEAFAHCNCHREHDAPFTLNLNGRLIDFVFRPRNIGEDLFIPLERK